MWESNPSFSLQKKRAAHHTPSPMKTTINCDLCGSPFQRVTTEVHRSKRRGRGQYCSRVCSGKARTEQPRIQHAPNVECALCQTPFYKRPSHLINSVHGIYFCCRAHKDEAQRLGGITTIQPPHYGTGQSCNTDYRAIARRHHPIRCVGCGYNKVPEILLVHHIDCDRTNNDPANLEWRCGRCHDLIHFQTKTGKWSQGESNS